MLGKDEIESRFGSHKATIEGPDATAGKHAGLRRHFKAFANTLDDLIDDGREKDLMWNFLEDASMWSHKAIAKNAPILEETPSIEEIKAKAVRVLNEYFTENSEPDNVVFSINRVTTGSGTEYPDSWTAVVDVDIYSDRRYIVFNPPGNAECEVFVTPRKPIGRRGPVFTD